MSFRKPLSIDELRMFTNFGHLSMSVEDVEQRVKAGATLEIESSEFRDSGSDWSRALLDNVVIGRMEGY